MPLPPPSMKFRCPACGWQKTTHPKSDALVIGIDSFESCPRCRHRELEVQVARQAQSAVQQFRRLLGI